MSILSGFKKIKKHEKTSSGYKRLSYWTSSQTVEFDDGKTAQEKLGGIDGITDELTSEDSTLALSAKAGKDLKDAIAETDAKIGSTTISSIGDGTVTGAISTVNSNLNNLIKFKNVTVTTGTTKYSGYYFGDVSLSSEGIDASKLMSVYVSAVSLNQRADAQVVGNNVRAWASSSDLSVTLRLSYTE